MWEKWWVVKGKMGRKERGRCGEDEPSDERGAGTVGEKKSEERIEERIEERKEKKKKKEKRKKNRNKREGNEKKRKIAEILFIFHALLSF